MQRKTRENSMGRDGESGQALVTFALMITAMLAMLALVIDLGLLFGQRRFDQNGADAAALKIGHMLAGSVAPRENPDDPDDDVRVYFSWPEADVFAEARRYAGLLPDDTGSALPTGLNQNLGLTTRNRLDMTLEFWNTESYPEQWCHSPSGPAPDRTPSVPSCARFQSTFVPAPADNDEPFRVRVTVSSTTDGFFVNAAALTCGLDEECRERWINGTPPAPTLDVVPACSRPRVAGGGAWTLLSDVTGNTTCAHAVVSIRGSSSEQYQGPGTIVPISTGYCQLTPDGSSPFLVLWGGAGQTEDCEFQLSSYANIVDLTDESRWCDGDDPDYSFTNLMPSGALGQGDPDCPASATPDPTWNRDGFVGDSDHPGNNERDDMVWWIAQGFNGEVVAGNKLPTYCNVTACSTQGNNVAAAFYCTSGKEHETSCDSSTQNSTGTYFFAKDQPGYHDVCPDFYGEQYGVGCRDVGIPLWEVPQKATGGGGGTGWSSSGSFAPDRVSIWNVLNFRIYCGHTDAEDPSTLCIQQPSSVPGVGTGNSSVYGRFIGPVIIEPCSDCNGGPSLNGNQPVLGD